MNAGFASKAGRTVASEPAGRSRSLSVFCGCPPGHRFFSGRLVLVHLMKPRIRK